MRDLVVDDSSINLTQLLKSAGLAESGGMAKQLVADGLVRVNGQVETRKRRRLACGDAVEVEGHEPIRLVQSS
jgi:ribosome-associated protein